MNKKNRLEAKYFILIILVIVAIFIAIFSFAIKDKRKLNPIEQGIKDIIIGVQTVIYAPIAFVDNIFDRYHGMLNVYEENRALKKQIQNYNIINTQNEELKEDINDLKKILNLNTSLSDYEYMYSTVISRNIAYWYNTITIDKGSFSGVKEDMVVINQDGLIGIVIKTSNFSSTVKLISTENDSQKISVVIKHNDQKVFGTINGYDTKENALLVDIVTSNSDMPTGSTVMTSGLSQTFPSGILVGTVVGHTTDEFGLTKILKVKSNVDLNNIRYVSILRRKEIKK